MQIYTSTSGYFLKESYIARTDRQLGDETTKIAPFQERFWSGRRDSNPRHLPWQGSILPLNYFRVVT